MKWSTMVFHLSLIYPNITVKKIVFPKKRMDAALFRDFLKGGEIKEGGIFGKDGINTLSELTVFTFTIILFNNMKNLILSLVLKKISWKSFTFKMLIVTMVTNYINKSRIIKKNLCYTITKHSDKMTMDIVVQRFTIAIYFVLQSQCLRVYGFSLSTGFHVVTVLPIILMKLLVS